MRSKQLGFFTIFFCIAFSSCHVFKKRDAAWFHNPENGYRTSKQVNGFNLDVQLQNADKYQTDVLSVRSKDSINQSLYLMLKVGLQKGDIFEHNVRSVDDYQKNIYYYSYLFGHDIHLEVDNKSIPCSFAHFEKSIDSKNQRTIHLAFEDPLPDADEITVVIESDRISGMPVRLKIKNPNQL